MQTNITAGITTIVPLLRKLTNHEAATPAIICMLPKIAEARPAAIENGFNANAVAFGLIKPNQNRNKNVNINVVTGPAKPIPVNNNKTPPVKNSSTDA